MLVMRRNSRNITSALRRQVGKRGCRHDFGWLLDFTCIGLFFSPGHGDGASQQRSDIDIHGDKHGNLGSSFLGCRATCMGNETLGDMIPWNIVLNGSAVELRQSATRQPWLQCNTTCGWVHDWGLQKLMNEHLCL